MTQIERLEDPCQWHYYVLSDDHGGSRVHELESALLLLEPSIELSVRIVSGIAEEGEEPENFGQAPPQPHILERYHSCDDIILAVLGVPASYI
jgi:hypothetical protein